MVVFVSTTLHAEVIDKEPSVVGNWTIAIVTAAVAFIAWRWRWWAGAAVSTLFVLAMTSVWLELRDPLVGPAIRDEAGRSYLSNFYASVAAGIALHLAAAICARLRRTGGVSE